MKSEAFIHILTEAKPDIMSAGVVLGAGMVFHQSPGYALGAALATIAFWLIGRKKCPADRVAVMIFTFAMGAGAAPMLNSMESLTWIPRPDPMIGEWEALAGFICGSIGGTALYAFVVRVGRSATAGANALADAAAKRLGLPAGETTVPDAPTMTHEEWAAFIDGLPEKQREAFEKYKLRAAHPARTVIRKQPRD